MPLVFVVLVAIFLFVKNRETAEAKKRQLEVNASYYRKTNARLERQLVLERYDDGAMSFSEAYLLGTEELKRRGFVPCIPRDLSAFCPEGWHSTRYKKVVACLEKHNIETAKDYIEAPLEVHNEVGEKIEYVFDVIGNRNFESSGAIPDSPESRYDSYEVNRRRQKYYDKMREISWGEQIPPMTDEELYKDWFTF